METVCRKGNQFLNSSLRRSQNFFKKEQSTSNKTKLKSIGNTIEKNDEIKISLSVPHGKKPVDISDDRTQEINSTDENRMGNAIPQGTKTNLKSKMVLGRRWC